jgi:2-aminoadipate transaminase
VLGCAPEGDEPPASSGVAPSASFSDCPAGVTQLEPGGVLDLRVGQPDRALLPMALMTRHLNTALATYGPAALAYGANAGPLSARAALAAWSQAVEGGSRAPEQVVVTAGATHALDLLCRELGRPGDLVLVQRASYNLALDLFRRRGLEPWPVGADACLPGSPELSAAALAAKRAGRRIAFAYMMPTFHNPTGQSWTPAARDGVLDSCRALGITIVEDDPYRELYFADPPPPSLAARRPDEVIGIRTLSKVLAPGARLGWILAERGLATRLALDPLFTGGGGIAHLAALTAASLVPSGEFAAHLAELRVQYRTRRDALLDAMAAARDAGAEWDTPAGGFFLWIRLPDGIRAGDVETLAARRGVSLLNGLHCHADPDGEQRVRISFSMHSAATLATAGEAIAAAVAGARNARGRQAPVPRRSPDDR